MFIRDLKLKKGNTHSVTLVDVHLPVRLGHRDAEKVFGAPLNAQLAATGLGTVLSCDTRKRQTGAAIGVDISLGLREAHDVALRTVAGMLDALSAPYGSSIRMTEGVGDPLLFGVTEGLEIAVETPRAPTPEMRRELAMTCREALANQGVGRGWDQRRDKTVFYFYGENYAEMHRRLARALRATKRFGEASFRRMA